MYNRSGYIEKLEAREVYGKDGGSGGPDNSYADNKHYSQKVEFLVSFLVCRCSVGSDRKNRETRRAKGGGPIG